ncbi:hypothetical protein AMAG_00689 [Allomyces macrogynus ATCC 38327]|uniref:Radial spoke head protein 9 homolog n=1 Tax=Allomyces macrogynus (strain ATCC 38327) TaxID=578462 RepID=A0A0L0RX75_ALLM3|nr:hypothetical protein AMAG_00689 [Allomyces macrogynus ATCC 38327]|eukprot:KNE54729.1 hypothetical protein AMAG_00689 [Allomyces macrogynus ATCC 38327]
MNGSNLHVDAFGSKGIGLSTEERACLATSLVGLTSSQAFMSAHFWGKIATADVSKDYYVAVAYHNDPFAPTIFMCQDALNWVQAPNVTDDEMHAAADLRAAFTGDPAFEFPLPNGAAGTLPEAKRLTAVVQCILRDAHIVPRGAYFRDVLGKLQRNATFGGLRPHDVTRLASYVHLRPTATSDAQLARPDFEDAVDVLDTVEHDQPKGCWVVEKNVMNVVLSSLVWPGYHHATSVADASFASIYVGQGKKNLDIGFMI